MKEHKKKRIYLLGLLAAAVLLLGVAGGAVLAQEGDSQDGAASETMASRVAKILGLGEDEVRLAFQQAAREIQDERFGNRMDRLVEKGQITEDEAGEAVEWYQSRPENIGHGPRGFRLKGRGHQRSGSRFGFSGMRGAGRFAHDGS